MKKLLNARLLFSTGKAHCIEVHLADGIVKSLFWPMSQVSVEELGEGRLGSDVYVEDWILEKKEEEVGEYILTEDM